MRVLGVLAAALALGTGASSLQPSNPTWSPDGTRIAYANVGGPRGQLVVMNADGSGKRSLFAADSCCEPILWATGNRIVFVDDYELLTIGARGGKPTRLFTQTPWFILSPDRQTIALDDGCGCGHAPDAIALVAVRGGKPFVVPRPKNTSDSIDGFSPDGTQLVFTRAPWAPDGAPKGKPQIMVENLHLRGPPVPLSRSGLIGSSFVPANAVWPQWSPDGKWIAYVSPGAEPKLELVSTNGGTSNVLVAKLSGPASFSWSPASTRIAFTGYARAKGMLSTVDLKGNERVLSGSLDWVSNDSLDRPQWTSDGTKLVFMVRGGGIWVVDADGTGLKQLAQ